MKLAKQSEKFAANRFSDLKSQFENNNNESSNNADDSNKQNGNEEKQKNFSGLSFKQPHRATLIPRHSVRRQNYDDDDDDEDTRDMTGRMYNSEGYEVCESECVLSVNELGISSRLIELQLPTLSSRKWIGNKRKRIRMSLDIQCVSIDRCLFTM